MILSDSLKKIPSYLFLFLLGSFASFSQTIPEKGVPFLRNFTPTQYQNKGKVWDIETAPNGIAYMAADKGLLEYDGKTWNSFKGSIGFTRSLLVYNDSLIYTGSDLDFGVWKRNKYLGFDYTSLYPFREVLLDVSEEFWHVHQLQEDIVFVSSQNMYLYKNQQLVKISAPSRFTSNFWLNDSLYFADEEQGLFVFDEFKLRKVFDNPENTPLQIVGIYQNPEGMVIVTKNRGLYQYASGKLSRLESPLSEILKVAKVFSFEQIDKTHVAFGTVLKGLYIAGPDGRIVHHINRHKGLPSNTVLALHYSTAGKLWLGMDYGISSLDLKNNLTYFFDYRGDFGTGYTALLKDEEFYLGTNQGLYHSTWKGLNNDLEFFGIQIIPETQGQVWSLENIDNTILMGHDRGLFTVRDNRIEKLSDQEGVWTMLPYKDYLLTCNYNGISIFRKIADKWQFLKKMDLILGSCNQLIIEKENILWVNIPNFGIIRAELDDEVNPVDRLIFPEKIFEGHDAYLLRNDKEIQVATDQYLFRYDPAGKKFIRESPSKILPAIKGLLPGIYKSVLLSPDYEFFPVYNGFALKFLRNEEQSHLLNQSVILRKMEAFRNHEEISIHQGARVPYHFKNFRIECIVPNQDNVLYQYRLDDHDEWSAWVPDPSFNLAGLKYGAPRLHVRAIIEEKITEKEFLLFRINAPWYLTWYAFMGYALLLVSVIFAISTWQKQSLKKQKQGLLIRQKNSLREQAEKHKQEILQLEQERLQAEYDQLKHQLKNKTIELANKARDNEEKNRLILTLKESCEKAQKNQSIAKIKLAEMHRILDAYWNVEDKTFEIQMDELHQDFFRKLKEQFPSLSNNDLRLCAYLKIGLNSKEIAEILNIQPSSSYISRSRLRKKLNLKAEEDLYGFLNTF